MSTITAQRDATLERLGGTQRWQLFEFDNGLRFMLTCGVSSIAFSAHFDAEQWAAFQAMVAGESES